MPRYHCYHPDTDRERGSQAVVSIDVDAADATQAATLAASQCRLAGAWTVIEGRPERFAVSTSTSYQARLV